MFASSWCRVPRRNEALLHNGGADIGIASERLSNDPTLAAFPWFRWHHSLLVPKDHPLTQVSPLTLEAIARWPLITYRRGSLAVRALMRRSTARG